MALTNNLTKQVDLPTWEWLRFAPTNTIAGASLAASDDDRYMYYLASTFWRYDTYTDGWQQLATPNIAGVTTVCLRHAPFSGFRGNILNATINTAEIAGLDRDALNGQTIRIISGTGLGQERNITNVADAVILDHGVVTACSSQFVTDTTKKWEINQYIGYQVRLVFGTGASQIRKILYNDANTLYLTDPNYQQLECWNNTALSQQAPYVLPVTTAGSQTHFFIESVNVTVSPQWDTTPDDSSSYNVLTGGIWMFSALAGAPWCTLQYYDIASDTWNMKTAVGGYVLAAFGTDFSIERCGEGGGQFFGSTALSGTAYTLIDPALSSLDIDQYANFGVKILSGTGIGQQNRIVGNISNRLIVARPWTVTPNNTSVYGVYGDTTKMFLAGNAASAMYQYYVESDMWAPAHSVDYGQTRQISIQYQGQEAYGMTTGARNTGGIIALSAAPNNGGTGYAVGDLFNITTGGTVGKGRVEAVNAGVVTAVSLYSAGTGYTPGASKATTIISGAGNNALTVEIGAVGVVGRITSATNTNLYKGDQVTIAGCTESAWNATYTILAIDSLTTFDIILTATAGAITSTALAVSNIVDTTKNWISGEHIGKICHIASGNWNPTLQARRITGNTATTLTLQSNITQAVNGISRYVITEPNIFGRDEQWKIPGKTADGYATSGTTATLVDTSKIWNSNQWTGYKFRIIAGTGKGAEIAITSNTATTLSFTTQTFTPDTSTKYLIMDSFGLATSGSQTALGDTTKNWTVNQWAGKRCKITSGTGISQEFSITSNTSNALAFASITTAPDTTSTYTILSPAPRGAAIQLMWIFGNTHGNMAGRYIYCPRGGASNMFDRYDITRDVWDITIPLFPQTETLTTGSMYGYDGEDKIYFTKDATNRIFALNVVTGKITPFSCIPYAHGTALLGNRFEMIETVDGLSYIYVMRHSGAEFWRALVTPQ